MSNRASGHIAALTLLLLFQGGFLYTFVKKLHDTACNNMSQETFSLICSTKTFGLSENLFLIL